MVFRHRSLLMAGGGRRQAARCLALALLILGLAVPPQASAAQCDYSGFDKPCLVEGGVYRIAIPDGGGPFPVMIYLYGSGGHSVRISGSPVFLESVVGRGYALIVPAARDIDYAGNVRGTGWSLRNGAAQVRDEITFLERVIDDMSWRFPVDRSRILIAGQSRGGFLIWEIACHTPELATAYAVHAGGYLGKMPSRCERPVRFLQTHGLADPIVPFTGRPGFHGGAGMAPIRKSLEILARTNGCDELDFDAATREFGFQRYSWEGCARGSALDLMLHDGGHSPPGLWFRAVLDWFEEPPSAGNAASPVTRRIGDNSRATTSTRRFKPPPAPGQRALARD